MERRWLKILLLVTLSITCGSAAYAANGVLKVTSFPTGAEVYVDGSFTGKLTPMSVNLSEGEHEVLVQIPDPAWAADTRLVTVAPGNNDLSVTLLPDLSFVWAAITDLQVLVAAQQGEIAALQNQIIVANGQIASLGADLAAANGVIANLQNDLALVEGDVASLAASPLFDLEPYASLNLGTLEGVAGPHLLFEGVNVHVRDGSGATDSASGLGNLIVGYNTYVEWPRTGAHNIVLGGRNGFASYGGLVAGELNIISGPFATVTGGQWNVASGGFSSVSGGNDNEATDYCASVSGGFANQASAFAAAVCGGSGNLASGDSSSVTGGTWNDASGAGSTVSGGFQRSTTGQYDWVAGGLFEDQ